MAVRVIAWPYFEIGLLFRLVYRFRQLFALSAYLGFVITNALSAEACMKRKLIPAWVLSC